MYEKSKLTAGQFSHLSFIDLQIRLELIAQNVDAYKEFLTDWGISIAQSESFVSRMAAANNVFLAFREKRQESTVNTSKLALEIKKTNIRVKEVINGLVLQFKKAAPSFYASFEKALRSDKTGSKPNIDYESDSTT